MIKYSEVLRKLAYGYPDESAEDIRLPGDMKEDTLPYMSDLTDSGSNAFTGTAPVSSDGSNASPSSKATPSDPYATVGDSWQPSIEPQYPSDRSALNNLKGRMDSKNPAPGVHRPDDATNAEWYGRYASKAEPWRLRQAQDLERKAKSGRTDFDYATVSAYQDRAAQRRMEITGKSDTELGIERRKRAQEEWKEMQKWDDYANSILNGTMPQEDFLNLSRADQDSVLRRVKQQSQRLNQFHRYAGRYGGGQRTAAVAPTQAATQRIAGGFNAGGSSVTGRGFAFEAGPDTATTAPQVSAPATSNSGGNRTTASTGYVPPRKLQQPSWIIQ